MNEPKIMDSETRDILARGIVVPILLSANEMAGMLKQFREAILAEPDVGDFDDFAKCGGSIALAGLALLRGCAYSGTANKASLRGHVDALVTILGQIRAHLDADLVEVDDLAHILRLAGFQAAATSSEECAVGIVRVVMTTGGCHVFVNGNSSSDDEEPVKRAIRDRLVPAQRVNLRLMDAGVPSRSNRDAVFAGDIAARISGSTAVVLKQDRWAPAATAAAREATMPAFVEALEAEGLQVIHEA